MNKIQEIAKIMNLSEDAVETMIEEDNKNFSKKFFEKLVKEGYVFEQSNMGGFSFYKDG